MLSNIRVKIIIDPELQALIPPLSRDEYLQLETNILSEGCRDPLVTWKGILVDGHNRYNICQRNKLPFEIVQMQFKDRSEAVSWIINNQLGRRNLTPESRLYLVGKQYSQSKQPLGTNRHTVKKEQNVPAMPTAAKLAQEHKVSSMYVKRAEKYAIAIDTIAGACGEKIKTEILSRDIIVSQQEILTISDLPVRQQKQIFEQVKSSNKKLGNIVRELNRDNKFSALNHKERLPAGRFNVLLVDPPWELDGTGGVRKRLPGNHYKTMSTVEIMELPVREDVTDDAMLFLWTTNNRLPDALRVIEAWGFEYKTNFCWTKDKCGLGFYNRGQHELLLIAKRGNLPAPAAANRYSSVILASRGKHSEKPALVHEMIEKMYPGCRYLELFARKRRKGWTVWGNEV